MIEITKTDAKFHLFHNVYELSKYLTTKPRKEGRENCSDSSDYSFTGTHSFEEALDLMTYGDEETLKAILKEQSTMKITGALGNVANRQRYERNVYGCVPNVPSYLIGSPINMINPVKDRISHKIVNIFLNMDCSAGVSKDSILKTGVKYLAVIDLLEKRGYRCNLYAGVSSNCHSKGHFYMLVRVKTDREPLNLKKICFTIAHPSFLRRIFFRWCEVFDFKENITDGYGGTLSKSSCVADFKECIKDNFIIWNYQDDEIIKCDIETVTKRLKEDGITLD